MTYMRVIPRDLFNESSLLKCYGQIYINLDQLGLSEYLIYSEEPSYFQVEQSEDDGSLTIGNIQLMVRGNPVPLSRPLNARKSYPLYAYPDENTEFEVFNDDGAFSREMLDFLSNIIVFLKQARALPDDELRRHAWVATSNGPFDPNDESFTTCCELVRQEKGLAPLHFTFKRIDAERYEDMLGAVPPVLQDDAGFLLGEAISDRVCSVTNRTCQTFRAFVHRSGEFYECETPLTVAEYRKGGFEF